MVTPSSQPKPKQNFCIDVRSDEWSPFPRPPPKKKMGTRIDVAPVCVFAVLALLFFVYSRRRSHGPVLAIMDPDDDVRENIIHYDEEGVGEWW